MSAIANSFALFSSPRLAFDELFAQLQRAASSIYIETYHLFDDAIAHKLISLLEEKIKRGIKVTLIVDGTGLDVSSSTKKRLEALKHNVFVFHSFRQGIRSRNWREYMQAHRCNHRKLILIDNKIAFVGGLNIDARELHWRDVFVRIKGPLLKQIILCAKEMVNVVKKPPLSKNFFYKSLSRKFSSSDLLIRQVPYGPFHRPLKKNLIKLINNAKKDVCIATPYLVPNFPFRAALRRAKKRGIQISILIPTKADRYVATLMNHFSAWLATKQNIRVFLFPQMMHAKYLVVDKKVCLFGSANMDYQTFNHNYELSVISKNTSLVHNFSSLFRKDCKKSVLFTLDMWKNRWWFEKRFLDLLLRFKKRF